jgi:hypothetical protein
VADQSLATTASETNHIDSDRGLIDKDQPRHIKKALLPNPPPTRSRHVGAVLLGCSQAFLNVMHDDQETARAHCGYRNPSLVRPQQARPASV